MTYPTLHIPLPPLDLRYTLVVVCMFLIASILCPVLWYLWIHAGSANANFFFAITLTYALAQVSTHSNGNEEPFPIHSPLFPSLPPSLPPSSLPLSPLPLSLSPSLPHTGVSGVRCDVLIPGPQI